MRVARIAVALLLAACQPDKAPGSDPCATPWGGEALPADAVYVDGSAGDDANPGTESSPFATLAAALRVGRTVAVQPGRYAEHVALSADGAALRGRCSEAVTLDGESLDEPLVSIALPEGARATVSGLTLADGWEGLDVRGGDVDAKDVVITGAIFGGLFAQAPEGTRGTLDLTDVSVLTTVPSQERSAPGIGIWLLDGYTVTLTGGRVEGTHQQGLAIYSASGEHAVDVTSRDLMVINTATAPWDTKIGIGIGIGVTVSGNATLVASGLDVSDSATQGVVISGNGTSAPTATLTDTRVTRTRGPDDVGTTTSGIYVSALATLRCERCTVEDNTDFGLLVSDGALAEVTSSTFSGTTSRPGGGITAGIEVSSATAYLEDVRCLDNEGAGVSVWSSEVSILGESTITGTTVNADGEYGGSLYAIGPALLTAEGLTITGGVGYGALLSDTTATLSRVMISDVDAPDSQRAVGLATLRGSTVLAGLTIQNVAGNGVLTQGAAELSGADLSVSALTLGGGGGIAAGLYLSTDTETELSGVTITGAVRTALVATEGATAHLTGVSITDTLASGVNPADPAEDDGGASVLVLDGASLDLTDAVVDGSPGEGLVVSGVGTQLTVDHLTLRDTHQPDRYSPAWGLAGLDGATLSVANLEVDGGQGFGVWLEDVTAYLDAATIGGIARDGVNGLAQGVLVTGGSTVTANALAVAGIEGPGVSVMYGAGLACADCAVTEVAYAGVQALDAALSWERGSIGAVSADDSVGGGVGALIGDDDRTTTVTFNGARIDAQPVAGLYLSGAGAYRVTACDLTSGLGEGTQGPWGNAVFVAPGSTGAAPTAWDGTAGVDLDGNGFTSAGAGHVYVAQAGARVCGNTFDANGTPVTATPDAAGVDTCGELEPTPEPSAWYSPWSPSFGYTRPTVAGSDDPGVRDSDVPDGP